MAIEIENAELVRCRQCHALILADEAEQCFFCDKEPLCDDCLDCPNNNCAADPEG